MRVFSHSPLVALLIPIVGFTGACSGSGGSSGSTIATGTNAQLTLSSISVLNNSVVPLNRPIELRFNFEINFNSVSSSSVQIQASNGTTATGSFSPLMLDTNADGIGDTPDMRVVVWQPSCPLKADFSDAGLSNQGERYTLRVRGEDANGLSVLTALNGRKLQDSEVRSFFSPNSMNPAVLFEDSRVGPPSVIVRRSGSVQSNGVSHVELGGDSNPDTRLYFERDDSNSQSVVVPGPLVTTGAELPLNLYSSAEQSVAFVVEFDQPVNPSALNISDARLRLEYLLPTSGSQWTPIETAVCLLENCSESGAQVSLRPVGVLPSNSQLRAVVKAGFEGLTGSFESTLRDQDLFAVATTTSVFHGTLSDPGLGADEIFEGFDIGGAGPGSLEDLEAELSTPRALWGAGKLSSSLNFPSDGGVGGNFDWVVIQPLEVFDTSTQTIVGGPNQSRSVEQITIGGVANVHDFIILAGSELRISGPNPFVVNATGEIRIEGRLSAIGGNARDVATLNTGSQPEPGGSGNAGGGDGGSTSRVRNNSTPRGDRGLGPFGSGPIGGQGGESGAGPTSHADSPENRRPGGGGGGRFNLDQDDLTATSEVGRSVPSTGMRPTQGGPGHADSRGAETNMNPALGGLPGLGAFVDGREDNNFFGLKADVEVSIPMDGMPPVAGPQMGIIRGELSSIHAGYGGGGGGDSLPAFSFPTPNWSVFSDEKGGGGGGGGGAVHLRALGQIRFVGLNSLLSVKGGRGANGENVIWVDRIGGTGGSGSGGHVILESATNISFELPPVAQRPPSMRRRIFIDARGSVGRVGEATNQASGSDLIILPLDLSIGGDGGAGLIQLHVPDAVSPPRENPLLTDLILPVGTEADLNAGDANALHEVMRPAGEHLLSNFGARSSAQTRWIDLRRTDLNAAGGMDGIRFLFQGIDQDSGAVQVTNEIVDPLPAILSGSLASGSAEIVGSNMLVISGSALAPLITSGAPTSNDIFLRNTALLRNFVLRITPAVGIPLDYVIQDAAYDGPSIALSMTVARAAGVDLSVFAGLSSPPTYELIPRFFSIRTGESVNSLPESSELRISFEGARADSNGNPDESVLLLPSTSNLVDLNALSPGELEFIRFKFDLNIDAKGDGVSLATPPLEIDFFRFPFLF